MAFENVGARYNRWRTKSTGRAVARHTERPFWYKARFIIGGLALGALAINGQLDDVGAAAGTAVGKPIGALVGVVPDVASGVWGFTTNLFGNASGESGIEFQSPIKTGDEGTTATVPTGAPGTPAVVLPTVPINRATTNLFDCKPSGKIEVRDIVAYPEGLGRQLMRNAFFDANGQQSDIGDPALGVYYAARWSEGIPEALIVFKGLNPNLNPDNVPNGTQYNGVTCTLLPS